MAKEDQSAAPKPTRGQEPAFADRVWGPFWNLRSEIDDLFEDFFPGGEDGPRRRRRRRRHGMGHGMGGHGGSRHGGEHSGSASIPNIDVIEKQDEIKLCAELPGMAESDIEVQVTDGMLTLSGEKKVESEEGDKDSDYYMSERSFGSFKRTVRLPDGIDQDRIEAHFKNGVLTVHLPKKPEAQVPTRRIEVKAHK